MSGVDDLIANITESHFFAVSFNSLTILWLSFEII